MSRGRLKFFPLGLVLLAVISTCLPSHADDKSATSYNETGNVLATIDKHGHFYQVSTDGRIYLLMCTKVKSIQFGQPECKIGDKPIAKGDTVHFRIDGDWAYMPPISEGTEEKLRILTTELKVTPPIPPAVATAPAAPAKDSKISAAETAVVIGTGVHVKGQHGVGWGTTQNRPLIATGVATPGMPSGPVMPTGPVMAVPVTGGPPVPVIATAPVNGGVITGVPVTGGAPITAIPVGPVAGVPVGGAPTGGGTVMVGGGGAPQWVHVLRIQTAGKIYQLECSSKPCAVGGKEVGLGDTLTVRTDKKHAYVSTDAQAAGPEQEYKLLEVTDAGAAPAAPPH